MSLVGQGPRSVSMMFSGIEIASIPVWKYFPLLLLDGGDAWLSSSLPSLRPIWALMKIIKMLTHFLWYVYILHTTSVNLKSANCFFECNSSMPAIWHLQVGQIDSITLGEEPHLNIFLLKYRFSLFCQLNPSKIWMTVVAWSAVIVTDVDKLNMNSGLH